mmetsp:Transcript_10658/g.15902  ORF Transcript_10658/g.15902 Transcript_10658/m.15902 type:complete len:593 (+) Transcript_10658:98-1876(+)|eukprot:CAMPEP_0167759822 /NCGR_PEP_ID=MMETSP0110_2-20121227/11236_1 /TAXON_ID=629695 /ORGANISM="Gymnochlora sp., Strain CCMP2014" /LENGTH=592 /DNA_ID=CAMNT_0007646249 /DNA_START=64 /DNA_END=1842 /DNA_ORIENTATION=+
MSKKKGKKMLLSEFTGPQTQARHLPTAPSGLGGGFRGGGYRNDRFNDRKSGFDRQDEDSRADGNNDWRGARRFGGGGGGGGYRGGEGGGYRREGGYGRYNREEGGSRYGDRRGGGEGEDDGKEFGRSDGNRDWRRKSNKFSGGGGGGGFGDRGGYRRDRFDGPRDREEGGRSFGRSKFSGGWGPGGGGGGYRGRDERPAHLRRFKGLGKKDEEPNASRNAFSALGTKSTERPTSRMPLKPIGVAGRVQKEEEPGKPEKSNEKKPEKNTPPPALGTAHKNVTALETAMNSQQAVSNKVLKSGLRKLDLNDDKLTGPLAVSLAKSVTEEKLTFEQIENQLVKEAASEGTAARILADMFSKLKIELGGGEKGEDGVVKMIEDAGYDVLPALQRKKTNADFTVFLQKHELEFLKGGPDTVGLVTAALEKDQSPKEILEAISAVAVAGEDLSMCSRAVGSHIASKVFKDSKSPELSSLETYKPLMERITLGNTSASVELLFALQSAWYKTMKSNSDAVLATFQRVHELKLCSHVEFEAWQGDRKKENRKGKSQCLLAVFKFVSELKAKNKPPEPDYDEDQDEDEEEEEFSSAPTFIK